MKQEIECFVIGTNKFINNNIELHNYFKQLDKEQDYVLCHEGYPHKFPCHIKFSIMNVSVKPYECYHFFFNN